MAGKGAKPGERRGGREKGARNKSTVEREIRAAAGVEQAITTGLLPLDVMLHRMRGTRPITDDQFTAAVAAAPYLHPRLSAVAQTTLSDLEKYTDQELRDEIARLESEENTGASDPSKPDDPPEPTGVLH